MPIINVFAAFMLLIAISIYDIIAVWHTKHMVSLANFQTESKVFAGLMIPYGKKLPSPKKKKIKLTRKKGRVAVLGGGDIGFPLLFAGAVMQSLFLTETMIIGFAKTLLVPLFATVTLSYLLLTGQKNKFYPAMPFITTGCLIGYGMIFLL